MLSYLKCRTGVQSLLAAALVLSALTVNAGVITLTSSFELESGFTSPGSNSESNSTSVYFDAFDAALGTLTGVKIVVDSKVSGSSFLTVASAPSGFNGAVMLSSSDHWFGAFGDEIRVKREFTGQASCMPGDGSIPGDRCFNIISSGSEEFMDTMTFGADGMGNFIGDDPWALTFRTLLSARWLAAPSEGTVGAIRNFTGDITVIYNYEAATVPPAPVPTPAPLMLMLSGLALLVGARNRRAV